MKLHSINTDQRLYVMPCGSGFTCYGFDVLDRKARAVAAWLNREAMPCSSFAVTARAFIGRAGDPKPTPGTEEHFAACAAIMEAGGRFNLATGKRCDCELVPALIGREGRRVEADYFGERIRFTVGKSMGWMPAHLRIHNSRSSGGEALLAAEVRNVRIIR